LGREQVMDEQEREALAGMPEILTVYRGASVASNIKGLSWTLTEQTAHWFGRRFRRGAYYYLATAEVAKADVLAYLLGRHETEIVVLPSRLRNVTRRRIDKEK
jgi:L-amino acid N-acyltransferase YncA